MKALENCAGNNVPSMLSFKDTLTHLGFGFEYFGGMPNISLT